MWLLFPCLLFQFSIFLFACSYWFILTTPHVRYTPRSHAVKSSPSQVVSIFLASDWAAGNWWQVILCPFCCLLVYPIAKQPVGMMAVFQKDIRGQAVQECSIYTRVTWCVEADLDVSGERSVKGYVTTVRPRNTSAILLPQHVLSVTASFSGPGSARLQNILLISYSRDEGRWEGH